MKRYAIYLNGTFIESFEDYLVAAQGARCLQNVYRVVVIIDMTDGALCYKWVY